MNIHRSGISSREFGFQIEEKACEYLQRNQYRILRRNYFSRYGEIDIIAFDEKTLVFVEVRYRKEGALLSPAESIDSRKIRKLRLTIRDFISKHSAITGEITGIRTDLCAVSGSGERLEFRLTKGIIDF